VNPYPADPIHRRLSELGHQEAQLVADLGLDEHGNFVTVRQHVRDALAAGGAAELADIVTDLLD